MKTPEQRQELVAQVDKLVTSGDMKVTEACAKVKISPVSYRAWKAGKTSYKGKQKTHGYKKKAQHKIIIHEIEPVKREPKAPKAATNDCVIIFCPSHKISEILAGARP